MAIERNLPEGFRMNKALGQNFIYDKNLLDAIVLDADIHKNDTVVEIGTGAGTLTEALLRKGANVTSFEVDERLKPIIETNLVAYNTYKLVFFDILKMSDEAFNGYVEGEFKVVANLPYYITTPLIMRFLESGLRYSSLTLTVQKEVAERLCAPEGTADYGAVTVAVRSYCDAKITRIIDRKMFYPAPNVDSAVICLTKHDNKFGIEDRKLFRKVVQSVFCARRKTLANNIRSTFCFDKEKTDSILLSMGLDPMIRGEKLSVAQFKTLTDKIKGNL